MKRELFVAAAVLAAILNVNATETFAPMDKDIAVVLPSGLKIIGGFTMGAAGKCLTVGNPNALNRADRAVIKLDLAQFMDAGKIKKAELSFEYKFWLTTCARELKIEHLTVEQTEYNAATAIGNNGELHSMLKIDPTVPPVTVELDITKQVNDDLAKGFGFCAFRISDPYIDKTGNPGRRADCIVIPCASIKFLISR